MVMKIDPEAEYTPKQIYNFGWIKNTKGNADYYFVLRLVNRGLLKARDLNPGGRSVFQIKGQVLIDYLNG